MLTKTKISLFLSIFLFLLVGTAVLSTAEPAAADQESELYYSSDSKEWNRLERYNDSGVYFWTDGDCKPVEDPLPTVTRSLNPINFPSLHLSFQSSLSAFPYEAIEPDCPNDEDKTLFDVVRDDQFFYYLRGGLKIRAANSAISEEVELSVAASYSPEALTLQGEDLYFADDNFIYRMKKDGTEPPSFITSASGNISWLKAFTFRDGITTKDGLLWVSGGDLYRWRKDGGIIKLHDGPINDIAIDHTGSFLGGDQRTYVFIATDLGLIRRDVDDGLGITLRTGAVHSVATDNTIAPTENDKKNIYITVDVETCTPVPGEVDNCTTDSQIYRHPLESTDFSNSSWEWIDGAARNGGGNNLRSDGTWLYYRTGPYNGAGNEIRRIRTDVDPIQINITADYLEVTQAIQSLDIDVPLIANRPTYARGYAFLSQSNITADGLLVSARLFGTLDGQSVGYVDSVNQAFIDEINSVNIRRGDASRSFIFRLPPEWVTTPDGDINSQLQLTMEVDYEGLIPETGLFQDLDNTVSLRDDALILHKIRPCLITVPILAVGAPSPGGQPDILPETIARARSIMPVENFKLFYRYQSIANTLNMNASQAAAYGDIYALTNDGAPYFLSTDDGQARADLNFLAYTDDPPSGCRQTFYVGMVHPDAEWFMAMNATQGGVSGGGSQGLLFKLRPNDDKPWESPRGGQILAHELSHSYGLEHINCPGESGSFPESQQDFDPLPFDPCKLSFSDYDDTGTHFGFDPVTFESGGNPVIHPDNSRDVMSYAADKWITATNWGRLALLIPDSEGVVLPDMPRAMAETPMLLLQGSISADQTTAAFNRLSLLPAGIAPDQAIAHSLARQTAVASRATTTYTLTLVDTAGQTLDSFPMVTDDDAHADGDEPVRFTQYVPWNPQTVRLQLRLADVILAEQIISGTPPTAIPSAVTVDETLESVHFSWEMSDPDGDPLNATVQYSPDGINWTTISFDQPNQTEVTLSTAALAGSQLAKIRTLINDGIHSIVITSESFTVPDHEPQISIGGIEDQERLAFGETRHLFGMAYDIEDGDLEEMTWRLTGPTSYNGSGSDFTLQGLTPGGYLLSLSATDSAGQQGVEALFFEVLQPEIVDLASPFLDGYCGDESYKAATTIMVNDGQEDVPVYMMHASDALYLCFNGMRLFEKVSAGQFVGIKLDLNASGSTDPLQLGDRGFFINRHGELYQTKRTFPTLVVTTQPDFGYSGKAKQGTNSWSAEIRIEDDLLGGWDHPIRMALHVNVSSATSNDNPWPATAVNENADNWAPAYFGTAPDPENRPPTADAGDTTSYKFSTAQTIYLDGSASTDPDGDSLTYSWTQISGQVVTLANGDTALPSFESQPVDTVTELRFSLTVNDGSASSDPAEVSIFLLPPPDTTEWQQTYLPLVTR